MRAEDRLHLVEHDINAKMFTRKRLTSAAHLRTQRCIIHQLREAIGQRLRIPRRNHDAGAAILYRFTDRTD